MSSGAPRSNLGSRQRRSPKFAVVGARHSRGGEFCGADAYVGRQESHLEEQKGKLVVQVAKGKNRLVELENEILRRRRSIGLARWECVRQPPEGGAPLHLRGQGYSNGSKRKGEALERSSRVVSPPMWGLRGPRGLVSSLLPRGCWRRPRARCSTTCRSSTPSRSPR